MSKRDTEFEKALEGKNIAILTLDNKWYKLFDGSGMPDEIRQVADRLNELLKRQGRLNGEEKKLKALKRSLLDSIMEKKEAADRGDKTAIKEIEQNKKLIDDCNRKLERYADEMLDLPREIAKVNRELMLLTMEDCYDRLKTNAKDIEEITKWIDQFRVELKKNVIRKQEKEIISHNLYAYMHDIFGPDVIELFDMKYVPTQLSFLTGDEKRTGENDKKNDESE